MPLDPDAQRVLALMQASGRPPVEQLPPEEARRNFSAGRAVMQPKPEHVGGLYDTTAPGPDGPVPVRVYRGIGTDPGETLAAMVYCHGGGWVLGDLDSHDGVCRHLANRAGICVISVDYRLAPEHRFPAALDDAAAVLRWAEAEAADLRIDPARLALGGDSAGGNLAASLAIMAARGEAPPVAFQLLNYPCTDLGAALPSYTAMAEGYSLTAASMRHYIGAYLGPQGDAADWRASPLRAPSLRGVAPAYVMTAGYDPLCDDGKHYAERLQAEDVRVTYVHHADQMHGFLGTGAFCRMAGVALDMASAAVRLGLAKG